VTFASYVELQDAIGSFMVRDEYKSGGSQAASTRDFISLVEADLNSWGDDPNSNRKPFLLRFMEMRATDTLTAGNRYLATPPDLRALKRIRITSTDPDRVLEYLEPDNFADKFRLAETGTPTHYTIIGDEFEVGKTPSAADTVEITYYAKISDSGPTNKTSDQKPLSDSNTSNWILANQPDIYLFGALAVASRFAQAVGNLAQYPALYERAVSKAIGSNGSKPTTGLRMRTLGSTP